MAIKTGVNNKDTGKADDLKSRVNNAMAQIKKEIADKFPHQYYIIALPAELGPVGFEGVSFTAKQLHIHKRHLRYLPGSQVVSAIIHYQDLSAGEVNLSYDHEAASIKEIVHKILEANDFNVNSATYQEPQLSPSY